MGGGGESGAGMHWGPLKSSDRGMGPRGHAKRASMRCGWWEPYDEPWVPGGRGGSGMERAERVDELEPGPRTWSPD